ncbi:MAG: hypothetical protein IRZ00_20275, partial [Gemmatimonadetes bacterium]|nr:hypothetical protein [Gemmatimonadota bacterium]
MAGSGRKSAVRGAFLLLVASCAAAPGRLAAQALVGGEAAAVGLPGRVAVERIEGGPTVVVYAEAAEPLVAVRVSFALDPAGGHAEALADILQRLARRGMEAQA